MKATKCKAKDLRAALEIINKRYDNNIKFNPNSDLPKRFTLRVKGPGKGSGYARSYVMGLDWGKKRRTGSACWHVHGHFFEALFSIVPNAVIYSRGGKITSDAGNWEDYSVGTDYHPAYASDCCECFGKI
jgi:hypothetical protein